MGLKKVKTYDAIFGGDEHACASYLDVHQGARFLQSQSNLEGEPATISDALPMFFQLRRKKFVNIPWALGYIPRHQVTSYDPLFSWHRHITQNNFLS